VPQNYSDALKPGMTATFTVLEHPGAVYKATLAATSDSVNTQSGTVLLQLQAANPGNLFNPGDYAQVTFNLPASRNAIQIPASALIMGDDGTQVALVGRDGRVTMKPVTILRDYGTSVEIASGLERRDRIIDNPPDSLRPGDRVRVASQTGQSP